MSYWEERRHAEKVRSINEAEKVIARLERDIKNMSKELEKKALAILEELGGNLAEAKRILTKAASEQSLGEYYRLVDKALQGDEIADAILDLAERGRRITRLDELLLQLDTINIQLGADLNAKMRTMFEDIVPDSYYRTLHMSAAQNGGAYQFAQINPSTVEYLVNNAWASGKNWSQSLWGHIDDFNGLVRGVVSKGVLLGQGNAMMTAELTKLTKAERHNVSRLVRTESAYLREQASILSYRELGVERYQYNATLDLRTSAVCRGLDLEVFDMDALEQGVNYPPMHPNCRSTTAPYLFELKGSRRTSRDKDGKTVYVDGNMNYAEWYEKYGKDLETNKTSKKSSKNAQKPVANSTKSSTIKVDNKEPSPPIQNIGSEEDVHIVGTIDRGKYKQITSNKILTDEVIITENRVEHIKQRRGNEFYEKYSSEFSDIVKNPEYVFKDDNENTAIVSKRIKQDEKNINIVLRLVVEGENPKFKNSILTAIGESDKRFAQRLRNNKPVYTSIDKEE